MQEKTMLEIQCSIEDYLKLRKFADYSSDLTHVLGIPYNKIQNIKSQFPYILDKYIKEELPIIDITPTVYIKQIGKSKKNKILIKNADIDILNYLEVRNTIEPEIKVKNLKRLFVLLKENIIKGDSSFYDYFYPIDENCKLSDLFSSNGVMHFMKINWSLKELGKDATIKDLEFDKYPITTKTKQIKNNLKIISYDEEKKILLTSDGENNFNLQFYYVTPNMLAQFKPGRIISCMAGKIQGNEEKGYTLYDPVIIPEGFKERIYKDEIIKNPIRKIPALIYNAAWEEYKFRKKEENDDSDNREEQ